MGSSASLVSSDSQRVRTSAVMSSTSDPYRSSVYFRASSRYSIWSWMAVIFRPSRSVTRWRNDGSWEIARSSATGASIERSVSRNLSLDHGEDQGGRAELQVGSDLAHIRVADDHMEPPVFLGVCVRLVPGVDDRSLQGGLEAHLHLEEVGPLADLETLVAAVRAQAHPSRAADDLPGNEERGQVPDDIRERRGPAHQVILMAAVRGAFVVGVVLVQLDARRTGKGRCPGGRLGHYPLAGFVPGHTGERVGALRCGVLRVGVVHVEPRPIGEDG